jgi:hypothetical protein
MLVHPERGNLCHRDVQLRGPVRSSCGNSRRHRNGNGHQQRHRREHQLLTSVHGELSHHGAHFDTDNRYADGDSKLRHDLRRWSGTYCTGVSPTCTLTLTANTTFPVTATFELGTANITSINHIIVFAQENRSLDSYYGAMRQYWAQTASPISRSMDCRNSIPPPASRRSRGLLRRSPAARIRGIPATRPIA